MQSYEKYLNTSERQGVSVFVKKIKQLLGLSLLEIRIFGSKVRGDFDAESDIDILLVIRDEDWHIREDISKITADINLEYGCNISSVIYTQEEHEKNKYFRTLFIQEVEKEGVPIG
jgi:predicted nucleotidyltransferase